MPVKNKLPRRLSIKRRRDIQTLLRFGRRLAGDGFRLVWAPAESFGYAIIVGRKHGNAVIRNRIKRLFREAIRLNRSCLTRDINMAVLPEPGPVPRFEAVNAEIGRIFEVINSREN